MTGELLRQDSSRKTGVEPALAASRMDGGRQGRLRISLKMLQKLVQFAGLD